MSSGSPCLISGMGKVWIKGEGVGTVIYKDGTLRVMVVSLHHEDDMMAIRSRLSITIAERGGRNAFAMSTRRMTDK